MVLQHPSDFLLAVLVPLAVCWLGMRTSPLSLRTLLDIVRGPRRPAKQAGHFSLARATVSYDSYRRASLDELDAMRRSYSRLGRAHKRLGYELAYPAKLDRLEHVINANAALTSAIANFARDQFHVKDENAVPNGDVGRVREALRHFVRDWSAEGERERSVIFRPILDVLEQIPVARRRSTRVLIPGSGLGRLAWEVSKLGFQTTAIELSHFMTLAFRFLLSPATTQRAEQHTLHPYAAWFSHQRSNDDTFRAVRFPDEAPRLGDTLTLEEGDFLEHFPPSASPPSPAPFSPFTSAKTTSPKSSDGYDIVITLFFIDTSPNILATLEHIRAVLRPGGRWINLGPLLWPSGAQARLELSLEEMLRLVEKCGFQFEDVTRSPPAIGGAQGPEEADVPSAPVLGTEPRTRTRTVVCEYTADPRAMMQWLYHAEFWVATKMDDAPEMD